MEEITAANNHIIELQEDGKWRIAARDEFRSQTLVEAQSEGPILFYHQDFGRQHGLPTRNWIPGDRIQRVLVGWAPQERCWVLGLQVYHNAEAEGTRWCELVRFPVSPKTAYRVQAQRAARALAEVVRRPLHIIRDEAEGEPAVVVPPQTTTPKAKAPYTLPVRFPDQVLQEIPGGLRLAHTGRWMLNQIGQVFLYLILSAVFGFLSSRTLTTVYAPMHQEWLPYAGLGLTVILGLLSVWQAWQVIQAADVTFHKERGTLYWAASLGHWSPLFRRQVKDPMPLRAIKAVVARNLTPKSKKPEWILFLQTNEDALVLSHLIEENRDDNPPVVVQAAAAIAEHVETALRVMMWAINEEAPHVFKCETCGASLIPGQLQWGEDGQMRCTFCGAPIDTNL